MGAAPYALGIEPHPDDLAVKLERLFDEKPAPPPPRPGSPSTEDDALGETADVSAHHVTFDLPDAPVGVVAPDVEFHREMDHLREQLDAAFEEVISRTNSLEGRVAELVERSESQTETELALNERIAVLAGSIEILIDAERTRPITDLSGVERAVLHLAEMTEDRIAQTGAPGADPEIEARLTALVAAVERLPDQLQRLEVPIEIDQTAIDAQLDAVRAAIEAALVDGHTQIGEGITGVRRVLRTMQERPAPIDIRSIEEVAHRAALPNAADIASLRREVEGLFEAMRVHEKGLGEIRATLDWIKDRLLQR